MSTTPIRLSFDDGCSVAFSFSDPPIFGLSTARNPSLDFDVGTVVYADVDEYTGAYEADALFSEQVFATSQKRMVDDFTVHAINYTEAPNESGITLTIGG